MKEKWYAEHFGRLSIIGKACYVLFVMVLLAGCAQAAPVATESPAAEPPTATAAEVVPPTATLEPSPTPTQAPTATLEPSPTPTQPPTTTPVPALAVQQEGFDAWCAPIEYAGTSPASQDAPAYAVKMMIKGEQAELHIPASYCVLSFQFNQPVPDGAALTLFDGANPFLKLPLKAAEGLPNVAWASVTHHYVINPPLWYVDYRLSVAGPDGKELWSQPARFARTQPGLCPDLTYPDPVTLYCNPFDPREIEPHPEDPDYPYNDMFD